MHALAISSLVFVLVFGGTLAGMAIRRVRPENFFTAEAKDTIRLSIGLVVTMTSLVLGMLVSSSKTFYDGEKNEVAEMSAEVIVISDLLAAYGPETVPLQIEARDSTEEIVDRIWPRQSSQSVELKPLAGGARFYEHLQQLVPKNEGQASVKAQLLAATLSLRRTYWLMFLQSEETSITVPLLSVVTAWLVVIFFSFGIFAPRIPHVVLTLIICALAASAAIFIILSMNSPFSGVLRISPAAVRDVLSQMSNRQ
jgi:Protein of unknown function (DUF4239)